MGDNKHNSGYYNSGNFNSGRSNSGNYNSGYYNSGNFNSGSSNSGNYNSGIFNTDEPKMRIFGKEIDLTISEFYNKYGYETIDPVLTEWKNDKLIVHNYKDAWRIAWDKADIPSRKWYLELPNFDPDIFFEITGIDVRKEAIKPNLHGSKVEVIVDGVKYTATID